MPLSRGTGVLTARLVLLALVVSTAVMVIAATLAAVANQSIGVYTRDLSVLAAEAGAPLPNYAGFVSLLNISAWMSVAVLAACVSRLLPLQRRWLIGFALFALALAADDALTLHEVLGPAFGIPEKGFYLAYALAAGALLWARWGPRFDRATVPFLLGGGAFALSGMVDQLFVGQYLLEDGLKLVGALIWIAVPMLALPVDAKERLTIRRVPPRIPNQRSADNS